MSTDIQQAIADLTAANVSVDRAKDALTELLGQEKVEDNWLLAELDHMGFVMLGNGGVSENRHNGCFDRGLSFKDEDQAQQADNQRLLYMRFVRAIARENQKLGWVCDWGDCNQLKYHFYFNYLNSELVYKCAFSHQFAHTHLYMESSVIQVILSQFTEPEIISCITKGMLI